MNAKTKPIKPRQCNGCAEVFTPPEGSPRARVCSPECRELATAEGQTARAHEIYINTWVERYAKQHGVNQMLRRLPHPRNQTPNSLPALPRVRVDEAVEQRTSIAPDAEYIRPLATWWGTPVNENTPAENVRAFEAMAAFENLINNTRLNRSGNMRVKFLNNNNIPLWLTELMHSQAANGISREVLLHGKSMTFVECIKFVRRFISTRGLSLSQIYTFATYCHTRAEAITIT